MQLRHLAERGSHRYNRILKSRQFGFTTLYSIDYLDEALWIPGMSCAILAHEQKYNEKIFSIVKRAFENLPDEIKPVTSTDTKYAYNFVSRFDGDPLDSSIYVATDVRSGTVQKLHITEAAWQKDPSRIDAGAKQAVPLTGSITEETTANGFNDFYDKYSLSESIEKSGMMSDFDYKTFFYAWWESPEYSLPGTMPPITPDDLLIYGDEAKERAKYNLSDGQLLWRRWKINELRQSKKDEGVTLNGLQLFKQEYPGSRTEAFQSGAGNVFDVGDNTGDAVLTKEEAEAQLTIDNIRNEEQIKKYHALIALGFKFWKMPIPGRSYVIGVDPSDGLGGDNGAIDIWDKEGDEQVAQWHGSIRPDILADYAAQAGFFYNEAFIGVENNMLSCVLALSTIYTRYFTEVIIDKKTKERTKRLGFRTSTKTRAPMIDEFREDWEEGHLTIHSATTFSEMKTFVKKENEKLEHATGKNDDALFAGFIARQMKKLEPKRGRIISDNAFV